MRSAEDNLAARLESLLKIRNLLMLAALYLIITLTLTSMGRPYSIELIQAPYSKAGTYIAIFCYPAMIAGAIYIGIKDASAVKIAAYILIVIAVLGIVQPMKQIYLIANGRLDHSQNQSIAGVISGSGCSKGRSRTCWIEFSYQGGRWKISPAHEMPIRNGQEVVVNYKSGILGRAWISNYQIRGG